MVALMHKITKVFINYRNCGRDHSTFVYFFKDRDLNSSEYANVKLGALYQKCDQDCNHE